MDAGPVAKEEPIKEESQEEQQLVDPWFINNVEPIMETEEKEVRGNHEPVAGDLSMTSNLSLRPVRKPLPRLLRVSPH